MPPRPSVTVNGSVPSPSRRRLLSSAAAGTLSLAGCTDLLREDDGDDERDAPPVGEWPARTYDALNTNHLSAGFTPPADPQRLLTFETTLGDPSGLAVGERTAFVGFNRSLYAVSRVDGRVRWQRDFPYVGTNRVVLANGRVYAGLQRGMAAFDARDGSEVWRNESLDYNGLDFAVREGVLYTVSIHGRAIAVDAASGEERWTTSIPVYSLGVLTVTDRRVLATPSPLYPADEESRDEYGVYALDRETGERLWSWTEPRHAVAKPAVADGTVYAAANEDGAYAIDAKTGNREWYASTDAASAMPTALDSTVFLPRTDGTVGVLDADSGRQQASLDADGAVTTGVAVTPGEYDGWQWLPRAVYFGTEAGTVHRVEYPTEERSESSTPRTSVSLGAPVVTPPKVRGKFALVGTADGDVHVLGDVH